MVTAGHRLLFVRSKRYREQIDSGNGRSFLSFLFRSAKSVSDCDRLTKTICAGAKSLRAPRSRLRGGRPPMTPSPPSFPFSISFARGLSLPLSLSPIIYELLSLGASPPRYLNFLENKRSPPPPLHFPNEETTVRSLER